MFPSFYFKSAKGKVIFLYMCQKKSHQKGHLQLIFLLERNKERKVGLCSRPSGYYACQLVCKWFILKSRLYTERNTEMGYLCPVECLQMPASWRPAYLQVETLIFSNSTKNWKIEYLHFRLATQFSSLYWEKKKKTELPVLAWWQIISNNKTSKKIKKCQIKCIT